MPLSVEEYGPDVGLPYLIIRQGVTDYMEILIKTLTWQQSQTDGVTKCALTYNQSYIGDR